VVLDEAGSVLAGRGVHLGDTTNNVAEYTALLHGLDLVKGLAAGTEPPKVLVRSDSELMVKQLAGEYRVKNPKLQPLFVKARALLQTLPGSKVEHVRREQNREADDLANRVLDLGHDIDEPGARTVP
jgi:ribonuclease HI